MKRCLASPLVKCLGLTLVWLWSFTATATPWYSAPNLLGPSTYQRLQERYPSIKKPEELEDLLREIGRRQPTHKLTAKMHSGRWFIEGERAELIADIQLNVVTRFLYNPLYMAIQHYIGEVDSPEIRSKIQGTIKNYLKRKGYPQSQIVLDIEHGDDGAIYNYKINEGDPCLIDKIEVGFNLPRNTALSIKRGNICDRDEIEQGVSELEITLREHGYNQLKIELSDIKIDPATNTAVVVISGVLGHKVRYAIVDNSKRFIIDDLFADEELTKIDPTIVGPDAMTSELARRYRNRGFIDVVVSPPKVTKGGEDEFIYTYSVNSGVQYMLSSIQFEGAKALKHEELLDILGMSSVWQTMRPLNLDDLQEGLNALRARYQQLGYWDVRVRDPGSGQKDKDTGTVRLTIQIDEGLPRTLKSITVKGNTAVDTETLVEMLKTAPGHPLDRTNLVDMQQAIRTAYMAKGYLYTESQIELKPEPSRTAIAMDVIVTINEGQRAKIGDITVTGLVRTVPRVVHRELLFSTGDWYDPEKINNSRRALTRLGIFRSVQIIPTDRNALSERETEIDLVVDVREGKAGNVSFGPGWSLAKGWNYGAEASYNNIWGTGRQASIRGAISQEYDQKAIGNKTLLGRKIGTGYIEPYIFSWPVDGTIALNQKAEWGNDLWQISYGGEVALQHKLRTFYPGSIASVFYGQKIARTEGSSKKEEELLASDVRIGSTGVRYTMDERDNLRFPTSGYTFDIELAWARYQLGGDLRYFRWDISHSFYIGILDDLVLAIGYSLTSYEGIERRNHTYNILPPSERLYAGGSESVRGYKPRSLGPIVRRPVLSEVDGNCVRSYEYSTLDGTSRTTVKSELRYRFQENLAIISFIDSGNVFLSKTQMARFADAYSTPVDTSEFDENSPCRNMRESLTVEQNIGYDYGELLMNPGYLFSKHYLSYGLSLSWLTPLGSVNLAYGLPWKEPKTEACAQNESYCYPRGKQSGHWLLRGEAHLNVGTRF